MKQNNIYFHDKYNFMKQIGIFKCIHLDYNLKQKYNLRK